jgi:2-polyprenyl-6-methoxyphenol hydroxylase-like FAD-dependent oxidoreductase
VIDSPIVAGVGRRLIFENGAVSRPFDLVVDAAGSRSRLAPPTGRTLPYGALWATLDWPANSALQNDVLEQRYRAASVTIGVLPIGTQPADARPKAALFWSIRGDQIDAWRAAGIDAWKDKARAIWPAVAPLLDQIKNPDQLTHARYAHRTLARPYAPALIHIGDSWHSASPQLGQGANMALLDAYALALALREAPDIDGALARAIRLRRGHVRLYQALTAMLTPVYQSDSRVLPWTRDRVVGPLSKLWPITWLQPALVSGLIGRPLQPLKLEA